MKTALIHTHTTCPYSSLALFLPVFSPATVQGSPRWTTEYSKHPTIIESCCNYATHTHTHSHKSAEPEYTRDYRQDSSIQNVWDWSFIGMGRIDIVDEVSVTLSIRAAGWLNENIWIWLCGFLRAFAYYYDISEVVVVGTSERRGRGKWERDATGNRIRLHSGTRRTGFG